METMQMHGFQYAQVVKLVDTLASGASARKGVEVRVFFWAPINSLKAPQVGAFCFLRFTIPPKIPPDYFLPPDFNKTALFMAENSAALAKPHHANGSLIGFTRPDIRL